MIRACFFALSLILISTQALSSVGKIIIASGEVFALDTNNTARELRRRSDIFEGDTLVTGANGSLQIRFNDNAILALQEESRLVISAYQSADSDREEKVLMDLLAGGFRTITGSIGRTDRDAYQVRTPNASIGIRGTHFELQQTIDALLVGVYEGNIRVSNASGELNLGQQEAYLFARVEHQNRPEGLLQPPPELIRPRTSRVAPPSGDDEDEATRLADSEDGGLPLNRLFLAGEPNLPPQQPISSNLNEIPSYLLALLEESPEKALEMAEPIISGPESGDYRLSQAQIDELSDTPRTGFVVLANEAGNSVHFAYLTEGDNGPVFANFESELLTELNDGYKVPDNVFKGPETLSPVDLATFNLGDDVIYWGRWDASTEDQAKLYSDPDSADVSSVVASSFFFVEASPSANVPLEGELNFTLSWCESGNCLVTNRPLAPWGGEEAYGQLLLSLDSASPTGSGYFYITTLVDDVIYEDWQIEFTGNLVGAQFFGEVDSASSSLFISELSVDERLTGDVDGLLVGSEGNFYFTGGFGVSTDNNAHSLSGIFLMDESGPDSNVTGQ